VRSGFRSIQEICDWGMGLALTLTPAATDKLARGGYDPPYGARPLKRLIQQEI